MINIGELSGRIKQRALLIFDKFVQRSFAVSARSAPFRPFSVFRPLMVAPPATSDGSTISKCRSLPSNQFLIHSRANRAR